jgi:hypothetical protein
MKRGKSGSIDRVSLHTGRVKSGSRVRLPIGGRLTLEPGFRGKFHYGGKLTLQHRPHQTLDDI